MLIDECSKILWGMCVQNSLSPYTSLWWLRFTEKWEYCVNRELKPNCQPADETNKRSNQTINQLFFFFFYGKNALWSIIIWQKMFTSKMLQQRHLWWNSLELSLEPPGPLELKWTVSSSMKLDCYLASPHLGLIVGSISSVIRQYNFIVSTNSKVQREEREGGRDTGIFLQGF